ncbi:uncharacterized protein SPSK_05758 [Sporothrix schenckii 1099-18]|uniref:Copia protein n=1 Tax=Sporothrix schenckii 1099-18 TaxID=1397361 RepID=A0A0F2LRN5_SPOSC|nr:uncharacterized protein SPSK_05758 [Sporothrix schenckii 1099-18]KJR80198.1 hypothetical protein SPSK_05758 [Sporothrix schenckii 1099-18]
MDNKTTNSISNGSIFSQRSKHFDIKYHYLREKIALGLITTKLVPTTLQLADPFAKALAKETFTKLVEQFMSETGKKKD